MLRIAGWISRKVAAIRQRLPIRIVFAWKYTPSPEDFRRVHKWHHRIDNTLAVLLLLLLFGGIGYVWLTYRRGDEAAEAVVAEAERRGLVGYPARAAARNAEDAPDNGARYYRAALALALYPPGDALALPGFGRSSNAIPLCTPLSPEQIDRIQDFVAKNAEFFDILAVARRHEKCYYHGASYSYSAYDVTMTLGAARARRLLYLAGLSRQGTGDAAGALDACAAMIDIDMSFRHVTWPRINSRRGEASSFILEGCEQLLSRLAPSLAGAERLRLKALEASASLDLRTSSLADFRELVDRIDHPGSPDGVFWALGVHVQEQVLSTRRNPYGPMSTQELICLASSVIPASGIGRGVLKESIARRAQMALDDFDAAAAPLHELATRANQVLGAGAPRESHAHFYWSNMRWAIQHPARFKVLAAALAAESYRIENGKWPDALSVLEREELLDPFTGKPLKYKRKDGDCIIYSVGMNQRDDGGVEDKSYTAEDRKDDIVFRLFAVEKRNVKPKAAGRKPDNREKQRRRAF